MYVPAAVMREIVSKAGHLNELIPNADPETKHFGFHLNKHLLSRMMHAQNVEPHRLLVEIQLAAEDFFMSDFQNHGAVKRQTKALKLLSNSFTEVLELFFQDFNEPFAKEFLSLTQKTTALA